jgi:hypothetical protein
MDENDTMDIAEREWARSWRVAALAGAARLFKPA